MITVECYTRTSGQSVTLTEACDGTHVVIYQRKTLAFCIIDFDQEQEHDTAEISLYKDNLYVNLYMMPIFDIWNRV